MDTKQYCLTLQCAARSGRPEVFECVQRSLDELHDNQVTWAPRALVDAGRFYDVATVNKVYFKSTTERWGRPSWKLIVANIVRPVYTHLSYVRVVIIFGHVGIVTHLY